MQELPDFGLYRATHMIVPDQIMNAPGTEAAKTEVLGWLGLIGAPWVTNPNIHDSDSYMFELYLDKNKRELGLLSGDLPSTRALIDLNAGTIIRWLEDDEPVALEPDVLSLLRAICEAAVDSDL